MLHSSGSVGFFFFFPGPWAVFLYTGWHLEVDSIPWALEPVPFPLPSHLPLPSLFRPACFIRDQGTHRMPRWCVKSSHASKKKCTQSQALINRRAKIYRLHRHVRFQKKPNRGQFQWETRRWCRWKGENQSLTVLNSCLLWIRVRMWMRATCMLKICI